MAIQSMKGWAPWVITDRTGAEFTGSDGKTIKTNVQVKLLVDDKGVAHLITDTPLVGVKSKSGKLVICGKLGTQNLWGNVDVTGIECTPETRAVLMQLTGTGIVGYRAQKQVRKAEPLSDDFDIFDLK